MSYQPVMSDIFMQYVTLRQGGHSVEETVAKLQSLAGKLERADRQQLGKLVQVWEIRNGKQLKNSATRVVVEQTIVPPSPSPVPFGTGFLDASKLPGIKPI